MELPGAAVALFLTIRPPMEPLPPSVPPSLTVTVEPEAVPFMARRPPFTSI